jgi:hypothetical protein
MWAHAGCSFVVMGELFFSPDRHSPSYEGIQDPERDQVEEERLLTVRTARDVKGF